MGKECSTHGEKRNAHRILMGKPEVKRPLEDIDVDGRIILKWILDKMEWYGLDSSGPGLGTSGGLM
jgi:hypothetical protein